MPKWKFKFELNSNGIRHTGTWVPTRELHTHPEYINTHILTGLPSMNGCQLQTVKLKTKIQNSEFHCHVIYHVKCIQMSTQKPDIESMILEIPPVDLRKYIYRLITAYLLLRVNLDKIMHAHWDFDASSAQTRRVSALDKHQNWSTSALFCLNSRAQSKYAVVNLIHTRRKQTFLSFIVW